MLQLRGEAQHLVLRARHLHAVDGHGYSRVDLRAGIGHRIHDGQSHDVASSQLAALPEAGGRPTAVVGKQAVAALQQWSARNQARTAHPARRQWRQRHAGHHVVQSNGLPGGQLLGRQATGLVLFDGLLVAGKWASRRKNPRHTRDARQGAHQGLDLRQRGAHQDQPGNAQEQHAGDEQADDEPGVGERRECEVRQQHVHPPGDQRTDQRGTQRPQHGLRHLAELQVPQRAPQQAVADDRAGHKAQAIGRTQQHHDQARLGGDLRRDVGEG